MSRTIVVEHLARVEGHGGITVELEGDKVGSVRFDVTEGIRLFEGLLRGRLWHEVPELISRVCAICSHGHSLTALMAIEDAFGIEPGVQTRLLRDLVYQGANIESHALHFFCLALPDLVGKRNVLAIAAEAPEAVKLALRLKKIGHLIEVTVGGRAVHPVNYLPGGLGRVPSLPEIVEVRAALRQGLDDCRALLPFLQTVPLPRFVDVPIRCAALEPDGDAPFFGRALAFSDGSRVPVAEYRAHVHETLVPHSHAKHGTADGASYLTGALARLTLHADWLGPLAREVRDAVGLTLPSRNVMANDFAQLVELVASLERGVAVCDALLARGIAPERPPTVQPRAGQGTAASEVPRGVLFHSYRFDAEGRVEEADVITPTAQNLEHLEGSLRAAVQDAGPLADDALAQRLEMVARAYDPCISCAVHVMRVG